MAKNRPATTPTKSSGFSMPTDMRRFISCGGGTSAYLVAGPKSFKAAVADLPAAIDQWLPLAGPNERDILLGQAEEMAERYPSSDWNVVVDHLKADAA